MTRRIITRASAQEDLTSQMQWYLDHVTPEVAERFLKAAEDTAETLLKFPNMGFAREYRDPALSGIRMHPVKGFEQYLIFYRPVPEGIELIRVYHAARDIDEIIRTRMEGVEQGTVPLIPHDEVVREFEERRKGEKPDQPEVA